MSRKVRSLRVPAALAALLLLRATAEAASGRVPLDPAPTFVAFTPGAVAVDPQDRTLWVADRFLPRLAHLAADGSLLAVIPVSAYGGGRPAGLAFESDTGDFLYVSDPDRNRVVRINRQGNPAGSFATDVLGILGPADIAGDQASASLHVVDVASRRVVEMLPRDDDGDGQPDRADFLGSFSTQLFGSDNPAGLALSAATGHLFVSDTALDRVFEVTKNGVLISSFSTALFGANSVVGLDWEALSRGLRVADAARKILSVSETGTYLGILGTAPFGSLSPQGLTFDRADGTWVAVTGERKLLRFQSDDPAGTGSPEGILQWRQEWTSSFGAIAPSGVALDLATGDRLISDSYQHRVFRVDLKGRLLSSFDTAPFGSLEPTGIAVGPGGSSLFVVDDIAKRIFEVSPTGSLLGSVSTSRLKRKPHLEPVSNAPRGVAYDESLDHLFLVDFQLARVIELRRNGMFVAAFPTAPAAPAPTDLAVDPAGDRIVVADSSGYLAEFSRSGLFRNRYPGVPLRVRISAPSGISVDPDSLQRLVTDADQQSVFFLSPSGAALGQIALGPYGILSASGAVWAGQGPTLYVTDRATAHLHAISPGPDGSFGSGDDSSRSYSTALVGSNAPVGLTLDRNEGKIGWGDEEADRAYWVTTTFDYLGMTDLTAAGVTGVRGLDRHPGSLDLFVGDAGGVIITGPSGELIQSLPASTLGIGDLGGVGLSPSEGILVALDRADRTLISVDLNQLSLP